VAGRRLTMSFFLDPQVEIETYNRTKTGISFLKIIFGGLVYIGIPIYIFGTFHPKNAENTSVIVFLATPKILVER